MEDDLCTGTPYRISCLRQQPPGVDRRCQIWSIRGYTRFWYTVMGFLKLISQGFPRPLPQSPLVFSRSFARFIFRSPSTIWTPGTGYMLGGDHCHRVECKNRKSPHSIRLATKWTTCGNEPKNSLCVVHSQYRLTCSQSLATGP